MITRIAHVGIATRSLNVALEFFSDALGLKLEAVERVDDQKVNVGLLRVGDARIELLEGIGEDSPITRFVDKRGPGIHHLTLEVDDIRVDLERLKARNVRLIDECPRAGADGAWVAFIHPNSTGGVLVELLQRCQERAVDQK
ncbi:MAG: methylmalonyl-CoA epimerase [Acidobacteria bacterium]|nr:methylmalonyl-CoA epimerase [Acidobacteriota bacterium]